MTAERTAEIGTAEVGAASTGGTLTLDHRPGRWIANWDAENKEQWESAGRSRRESGVTKTSRRVGHGVRGT